MSRLLNITNGITQKYADLTNRKKINFNRTRPVVSFTFDDVPFSAFDCGQRILDKYEFFGTFYISASQIDELNAGKVEGEFFTESQLLNCYKRGHEIGCHTYSHRFNHRSYSSSSFKEDLVRNESFLSEILPGLALKSFSFPYGAYNRPMKYVAGNRYASCRSIHDGVNGKEFDANNLNSLQLYESRFKAKEIITRLEELMKGPAWLILYTHDVRDDYSKYGCSPTFFETIVSYCKLNNIDVESVGSVVESLFPQ